MKTLKTTLLVATVCAFAASAQAAVVATWNTFTDVTSPFDADSKNVGISTATVQGSAAFSLDAAGGNPGARVKFSGTGLNGNTLTYTLVISGASVSVFDLTTIEFDYSQTATFAAGLAWSYQIDGGSSTSLGSGTLSPTGGESIYSFSSFSLASIPNLFPTQTLTLLGTLVDNNSGAHVISFDNINFNATLSPVPEPITLALPAFACIFAGLRVARWAAKRRV